MKTFKLLFALLLVSLASQAQFKSASLQAAGLTCAMCTKAVGESLKAVPFVESIKPDIRTSQFIIQFKQGADVDPDVLKKAVEDAGFSVAKLKLTGQFDEVKVEKDAHVNIEGKTFHFINAASQTLKGEKTITIVDKDFVPAKEFKKYASATSMPCVQTGKAVASCCAKDNVSTNTRIYHVII
ncbi:MAG TPA: heavy metal-associated domain-containing protein [Chitinophagaceae bacterium]|nr:heavy metal-associated domain-containing protein [Chitinophagaceae bacterium]